MVNKWGNNGNSDRLAPKSLQMVTKAMKLKDASPWKKSYDQPRQHMKKQILLCGQACLVKAMVFQ